MIRSTFALLLALAGWAAALPAAALENRPVPAYTQTLASRFANHAGGKYFQFHGDLPAQKLALYATFSDMFVELVEQDFFRVKTRFPIQTIVLEDKGSFKHFLRNALGVQTPPDYGIYLAEAALFVTYDGSGLGTFTHEIMHPLVEESLPHRPAWAMEGIPAFFEKFYGHVENGRLHVQWGYQNPWRIEMLGPKLKHLKLDRIVNGSEGTSEKRLVTVYLNQRGKLKTFLELVQVNAAYRSKAISTEQARRDLAGVGPIGDDLPVAFGADPEKRMILDDDGRLHAHTQMVGVVLADALHACMVLDKVPGFIDAFFKPFGQVEMGKEKYQTYEHGRHESHDHAGSDFF